MKASALLLAAAALGAQTPVLVRAQPLSVTEAVAEAPDLEKVIAPIRAEIRASFEQPLVEAPKGLFRGRGAEENLLGYWIADCMRTRGSALAGAPVRFAITNRGGIRANIKPGLVKVGDVFEVMPFENELVIIELTGAEILKVIREGLIRRGGEPCSGVLVRVDGTPEAPEVTVTWDDGSPIDQGATYKVATTDYLFGGGDSIPTLKKGRKPFTTGLVVRQILLDVCFDLRERQGQLLPLPTGRFRFARAIEQAIAEKRGVQY